MVDRGVIMKREDSRDRRGFWLNMAQIALTGLTVAALVWTAWATSHPPKPEVPPINVTVNGVPAAPIPKGP